MKSEARFTTPTDLCPHPERWHSADGDSTEQEVTDLVWGLTRALQPDLVVETGTGWGATALSIARALQDNGIGVLHTFETDPERVEFSAVLLVALPAIVHEGPAHLDALPDVPVDLAWIDTFYETRLDDYHALQPRMRAGSVVCFHDTAPDHGSHRIPGGIDLRTVVEGLDLAVVHLPTPRGVTIGVAP